MNAIKNAVSQRARPRLLSRNSNSSPGGSSTSLTRLGTGNRLLPAVSRDPNTIIVSLPNSAESNSEAPVRRRGGGRGREWMGRCHRLIQAMLELEESKPFRDPVNELMFPDYSNCVEKHMDLSRVMMNLHSGLYQSPSSFDADIRLIFSNWKKYNKDPSSTIYSQLYKLSWWYNREFTSLMAEVAEKFSGKANNSLVHTKKASPGPGSSGSTGNSGNSGNAKAQLRKILPANHSPAAKRKRTDHELQNSGEDVSYSATPASRFAWTTLSATTPSSAAPSQELTTITKSSFSLSSSSATTPVASTSTAFKSSGSSNSSPAVVQPSASNESDILSMELDVTNIWLGSTRVRPSQPVKLTEEGFQIFLAPNSDFSCTTLTIPMKDIVRAVGHLSKSKKHSLFVFVTPSIEKEMRSLFKGNPTNLAKSKIECFSLVTIFVKALSSAQISKLIHIFWIMSRTSIFGQLFSETDQMGALSILASIKPNIMHRVAEKHNDSTDSPSASKETNSTGKATTPSRTVNRAASGPKQVTSRLASELNAAPRDRTPSNQSSEENRESPTDVSSSSAAQDDKSTSRNGVEAADDGDLEIVDPSESVEDAAMEAMLADEDDLVMMKTVVNTKCPITQLTMTEPVKNKNCGHTYDKQGVQQHIVNRGKKAKCPVPGCSNDVPLEIDDMEKDTEVEEELQKSK